MASEQQFARIERFTSTGIHAFFPADTSLHGAELMFQLDANILVNFSVVPLPEIESALLH